ncbi:hypothetical protein [Paenibacillus odorifer]|nr:hypothetical protein [Paenibacillus odorifer]
MVRYRGRGADSAASAVSGFGCEIPFRLLVQFQVWDMGDCRAD